MKFFFQMGYKILLMPGWGYGKTISNDLDYMKEPKSDRCINCGEHKPVKTRITMEFGEGNYNSGPICVKCYSSYVFNRITYQEF